VAAGGIWLVSRSAPQPDVAAETTPLSPTEREAFHRILASPGSSDAELFPALDLLSRAGDPAAREALPRIAARDSALARQAAARAAGHFLDRGSWEVLLKLVKDPVESVRVEAIRAVGDRSASERRRWIEDALSASALSPAERLAALTSELRISSGRLREQAVDELTRIARSETHPLRANQAAAALMDFASTEPGTRAYLRELLESGTRPDLAAQAIENLAAAKDPFVPGFLRGIASRGLASLDGRSQAAVLETLSRFCPADRWKLLEQARVSRDRLVQSALIRELARMGDARGIPLLQELIQSRRLGPGEARQAREALRFLQKGRGVSRPCEKAPG
jgi:HEAT repeat protein